MEWSSANKSSEGGDQTLFFFHFGIIFYDFLKFNKNELDLHLLQ